MRATVAALLLASASILPLAARADTVDVMTVTGNGHTWTFDFPTVETIDYAVNLAQFIPSLTPLSENLDGAPVTPTSISFHPGGMNISGPFGTLMDVNVLAIQSVSGPFVDSQFPGGYDIYTMTFDIGTFPAFGTIFNGTAPQTIDFTVNVQQESVTATPEPSGLILLATALLGMTALLRRSLVHSPQ